MEDSPGPAIVITSGGIILQFLQVGFPSGGLKQPGHPFRRYITCY
jgi:hypothetical protein